MSNLTSFPIDGPTWWADWYDAGRGRSTKHGAQDLFGPLHAGVRAAHDGVVTRATIANPTRNTGNTLTITGTVRTFYSHLHDIVVRVGQRVAAGDLIAHQGGTGNMRGSKDHLHFAAYHRVAGQWVKFNPHAELLELSEPVRGTARRRARRQPPSIAAAPDDDEPGRLFNYTGRSFSAHDAEVFVSRVRREIPVVHRLAKDSHVHTMLVLGIAMHESSGLSTTNERTHDYGVMQVNAVTLRHFGYTPDRVMSDRVLQWRLGIAALALLYRHFPRDYFAVCVGYKMGRGGANRWIRRGRPNGVAASAARDVLKCMTLIRDVLVRR